MFSFYATKPIATGEGGMIVTRNPEYAATISNLRLHGIDRTVWDRYQGEDHPSWEYDVTAPGYKYNLSDIFSAIGRVQLKKARQFLERRQEIARLYRELLGDENYLVLPEWKDEHCWHLFIIRLRLDKLKTGRDRFLRRLSERNIGVSLHYKPLHLMTYYKKTYGLKPEDFPVTLDVYRSCFSIPVYPGLTDEQVEYIAYSIKDIGRNERV